MVVAIALLLLLLVPAAAARAERRIAERPAGGPAGSPVVLHGSGYLRHRAVRITAGRRRLALVWTDGHGAFAAAVRIPARAARHVTLVARDAHAAARTAFHVSRSASVRQASEVASQSGA